jgi:phosphoserine aminotransferase
MNRVFNFNPGPATLPIEALEVAKNEFLDYKGLGMSVFEMSHRSKDYEQFSKTPTPQKQLVPTTTFSSRWWRIDAVCDDR